MESNERQLRIIEILSQRHQETMANLAFEFGVSIRTIKYDIDFLSLSYPLVTIRGRYGGGVQILNDFKFNQKYLKPEQQELLERLRITIDGNDLAIINSILNDFALKR